MSTAFARPSTLAAYRAAATHGGVAAADPHQLVMMLMDGALERIARARGCMQHGELGEKNRLIHAAVSIVDELRNSLNREAGGEIAANLDDLYDYMCRRLVTANLENRVEMLDEVGSLLNEIRSAWAALPQEVRTPRTGR